jgi:hypothetical protein
VTAGAVSDRRIVVRAQLLRLLSWALELGLAATIVLSVAAFGAVHEWAYVPLWWGALGLAALLAARGATLVSLSGRLGPQRFAFHRTGRWLVLGERSPYGEATGWSFDLSRPALPAAPLALPGAFLLAWGLAQLLPLPPGLAPRPGGAGASGWSPISVAPADTLRGLAFVATALAVHVAAAAALESRAARDRLRVLVAVLGVALAIVGLAQRASGIPLIYGFFQPLETSPGDARFFGPFVNRNHFAAYLVMVAPVGLERLERAWQRLRRRVGTGVNLRRRLTSLDSEEGSAVLFAAAPPLLAVGALVATLSRGGLLAFLGGAAIAVASRRARVGLATAVPLALAGMALAWFGVERVGARFERLTLEPDGRQLVWADTARRLHPYLLAGSGLNTFEAAMSRVGAWRLPEGATPWSPEELGVVEAPRLGYYMPEGSGGWYREAHNDYLQMAVEGGGAGFAILVWGAWAVLRRHRNAPWILAALGGVMLHSLVDFPMQIPAVAMLFVTLAALPASPAGEAGAQG